MGMQPCGLPVPNSTLHFWRTEPHPLDEHCSKEELPSECDVLIIGAGYAGITTAYYLLDGNDAPPSIVLLEARQGCSAATGRNGSHLKPSVSGEEVTAKHGLAAAVEVALFEIAQLQAIKDLVEKEKIDCELSFSRTQHVITNPDILPGLKALKRSVSGVKGALAVLICDGGQLWPYTLFTHLLGLVVAKGVNLQTNTPVLSLSKTADEVGYWHANTARGSIKAQKFVYTTNVYTSALLPEYAGVIFPARAMCSHIKIPSNETAPKLPGSYNINFNRSWDYLIQRPDRSIIVGGGVVTFRDNYSLWRNIFNNDALTEPVRHYFDDYMQRNFKGWEESGVYVDKLWSDITGHTSDTLPHVGSVPNRSGSFFLSGFNGHRMPVIFLAAKGIARMIRDGKDFGETGMPLVYQTTEQRLAHKV